MDLPVEIDSSSDGHVNIDNNETSVNNAVDSPTCIALPSEERNVDNDQAMEVQEQDAQDKSRRQIDRNVLAYLLRFFKKYKLAQSEAMLRRKVDIPENIMMDNPETDVNKFSLKYKSEVNPALYNIAYENLLKFIENALNTYRYELGTVLYPVFIHMYLELTYSGHKKEALKFMNRFKVVQECYHRESIEKFAAIDDKDHLTDSKFVEEFRSAQYTVSMSRETCSMLRRFLKERGGNILSDIIESHIFIDVYEDVPRNRSQIELTAGGISIDKTKNDESNHKVYYGLLKEPDLQSDSSSDEEEEDETSVDGEKTKKRKAKKDPSLPNKKVANDPNAPPVDRMPFPELSEIDKMERIKAMRESSKRVTVGPDSLPSVCCYTIFNSNYAITCTEICEDGSMLAVGYLDSKITIWSLTPQKLKSMKPADQLEDIDVEADDVLTKIMDDKSGENYKTLFGHSGPVFKLSFSPDRMCLLSCSADGSIRLWCLLMWTCLIVYKGHLYPVWDVEFSPYGYYFVSGGQDKTARLWCTDDYKPLRLFSGHAADVDIVRFHPNSNYVASASSDRTVRLWDCVTGMQVRLMTGYKGHILAMCFSVDGRFLVSSDAGGPIHIHDLSNGYLLATWKPSTTAVTLAFSREGNILASGTDSDHSVQLWDFTKFFESIFSAENGGAQQDNVDVKSNTGEDYLLKTLHTKKSPLLNLLFTRRNVLYALSRFKPS